MPQKTISNQISEMYDQLNQLIENSNYDLQDDRVQKFSRKLDELITMYSHSYVKSTGKTSLLHIR